MKRLSETLLNELFGLNNTHAKKIFMPVKATLEKLPDIETLRLLTQSLAMLDAIMSPDWESRYHSFNAHWGGDEMMASMRDGAGNDYFILFNPHGAVIEGFDHESEMSPFASTDGETIWPGVLDSLPTEFTAITTDAAFSVQETTFCIWRRWEDEYWQTGTIEYPDGEAEADGSGWLLFLLDTKPETYWEWAKDYYEADLALSAIGHIYAHKPLTDGIIYSLRNVN